MASFEIKTEQRAGELVVRLSGELDLDVFDEVDAVLTEAQMDGNRSVRVDLRGLDFIDSTGIRLLLLAHGRADKTGDQFCIVRGTERVQRIFALTDLDQRLPFCEDDS